MKFGDFWICMCGCLVAWLHGCMGPTAADLLTAADLTVSLSAIIAGMADQVKTFETFETSETSARRAELALIQEKKSREHLSTRRHNAQPPPHPA